MKKLTVAAQRKLDRFDNAATAWGWTSDQGWGSAVDEDQKEYELAKADLTKYILSLQTNRTTKKGPPK